MTANLTREEMVTQIRAAYARPARTSASADRLDTMDMAALRTLHGKLARLAERSDLQGHTTPDRLERRKAAKARFKTALKDLKALKEAKSSPIATPVATSATPSIAVAVAARKAAKHVSLSRRLPLPEVRVDASLRAWQEERDRWVAQAGIERDEVSLAELVRAELLNARGVSAGKAANLIQEVLDPATHATIRKILEVSHLEVARVLRSRILELPIQGHTLPNQVVRQLMIQNLATAFEPVVIGDPHQKLAPPRALEGLAKMQAYAIDFAPDYVYVPDRGSQIVGQFLVAELKSKKHSDTSLWRKGTQAPDVAPDRDLRFLFVADIAMQAKQFTDFQRRVQREYGQNVHVRFAALVGSTHLHEELNHVGAALVTHVSPDGANEPPWNRSGGYSRDADNHVFGSGAENPLTVPDPWLDPENYLAVIAGARSAS